ncbi:MAG: hypothetical protein RLZZ175_2354 [Bacteroidota bacterium]|jgi:D-3-phosphoglycerate dehydrogenase
MKILIIDKVHEALIKLLTEHNIECTYLPEISAHEVGEKLHGYNGLVLRSKLRLTSTFLSQYTELRFIARAGAGVDEIDEEFLKEKNITLLNAPEGNRDAVGEHTIAMLLCLMNKLIVADKEVKNLIWHREANRGFELGELTVGIIGYGNMGKSFAKRLSGFGCKVIAYDKYKTNFSDEFAQEVTLEQLQKEADVVSLHVPLTNDSKNMCNDAFWNAFAKPVWFINTARGEVAMMEPVLKALQGKKILGAALDVLENERLSTLSENQTKLFKQLASLPNVIMSPHVAGWSVESYRKISTVLAAKIIDLTKK